MPMLKSKLEETSNDNSSFHAFLPNAAGIKEKDLQYLKSTILNEYFHNKNADNFDWMDQDGINTRITVKNKVEEATGQRELLYENLPETQKMIILR